MSPSGPSSLQVKITSLPLHVSLAQHLPQMVFTVVGRFANERIFCVSESPVSQLRFMCVDCAQRNITDMFDYLNRAQDMTHETGFPTVTLPSVEANPAWTGVSIMCQAAVNGGTKDSPVSVIEVRYLRNVHVVDTSGQGPVLIPNQGFHFYVECVRGQDGLCQPSARRKTLRCAVQANPPANKFGWLKNGQVISGNGPEITIGTEMIGHSLQCAANNGLYAEENPLKSEAVSIDPYTAARLLQDNFQQAQSSTPFQSGNRVEMGQSVQLNCLVEGNPRPVVFWKLRRPNGAVVDASCPQGLNGQYRETTALATGGPQNGAVVPPPIQSTTNLIRLQASCILHVANYSFSGQYWCSACSYVSQGFPECSPGLDAPGERLLNLQVQGAPQMSEVEPSVEQPEDRSSAIVLVHFCAEPSPRPPRELVFTIDGNDIQLGQTFQHFTFDNVIQNNTVPNCFVARLRIAPVREDDQGRQIVLRVQNQFGTKQLSKWIYWEGCIPSRVVPRGSGGPRQKFSWEHRYKPSPSPYFNYKFINSPNGFKRLKKLKLQKKISQTFSSIPVSLGDLLGVDASQMGSFPGWAVWLTVAALGILFSCSVMYCMRKNLLCFYRMKDGQQYSTDNLKAGVHDSYNDENANRQLFGGSNGNGNESPYEAAVHVAFSESRISAV
uniref:Ig-like domain-containing protein n=1 Tax=Meloidogyne hapla TaxID=6305 RepID=A0A1I8BTD5_MELHA